MTTGTLALIIYGAILAQVGIALAIWYLRHRHDTPAIPSVAPSPTVRAISSNSAAGWTGLREFRVQRRVFEDANHDICSFYLAPVDGGPLPRYKPGQYLTFQLPVTDPVSGERKNIVRCYSLSDRPDSDYYRISVKRNPSPPNRPDLPPGLSSNHLHDHVQEGDVLQVKAPAGHFYLIEEPPLPAVMIAGGIGITPMLSMINTLLMANSPREVWLFYGVRNGTEVAMKGHLETLAGAHPNFHLQLCYSDPREDEVEGVDYQHRGRVDIPLLRNTLKMTRHQFYVCGPKPMMESIVPGLQEWGVDDADIHYESFGPASLAKPKRPVTEAAAQKITVTFSKTGKQLAWDPAAASLLEFCEAQGIDVASGCRAGSCGSCQTVIEAGEVEYLQAPDADIAPGHCLLCISTPKGDVTLAA